MNEPASARSAVIEIVSTALDVSISDLRVRPAMSAHGWDSLSSLDVLAQLEKYFDIRLDLRSFHASRTVDDLVELVTATGAEPGPA